MVTGTAAGATYSERSSIIFTLSFSLALTSGANIRKVVRNQPGARKMRALFRRPGKPFYEKWIMST